jgi:hypothetical protein
MNMNEGPDSPERSQTDEPNTWYDEVSARPSTLPNVTISLTGFASEDDAQRLGEIIREYLMFFGKIMDLSGLSRVWVVYDYEGTLANLERGFKTPNTLTPTKDEIGVGIAMTPAVLVDGVPQSVMVLNAFHMMALTQPDNEELKPYYLQMAYTLAHECGHVHDLAKKMQSFPETWLSAKLSRYDGLLFGMADSCWSEYIASRLSALVSPIELTGQYESTFCEQLEKGIPAIRSYLREYRMHGDVSRALTECSYVVDKILTYASYLFGQLDGLGKSLDEGAPKAKAALEGYPEILVLINRLESELSALHGIYGKWPGFEVFEPLKTIALNLFSEIGLEIEQRGYTDLYVKIPISGGTVPNLAEQMEFLMRRSAEA